MTVVGGLQSQKYLLSGHLRENCVTLLKLLSVATQGKLSTEQSTQTKAEPSDTV